MAIFFLLISIAVIVVAALMLTGRWSPTLGSDDSPRTPETIDGRERFDVVLRGYKMEQVDETIESLRNRIEELEARR